MNHISYVLRMTSVVCCYNNIHTMHVLRPLSLLFAVLTELPNARMNLCSAIRALYTVELFLDKVITRSLRSLVMRFFCPLGYLWLIK